MSLYEAWVEQAFDKNGMTIEKVWDVYLEKEQKIYEDILANKITHIKGKLSKLASKYDMSNEFFCGFCDGISGALTNEFDAQKIDESTDISLEIDFKSLYKKMVEYKVPHLYTLPEWNGIFSPEEQKELYTEQKKSGTFVRESVKVGRNDPCPCGSGKKYKTCCGMAV